jgi:hypothetical protein
MIKRLFVLFFCLFLVMIGFGMTLPVFAFYTSRLAIERGASRGIAAGHPANAGTKTSGAGGLYPSDAWGRIAL